MEEFLNLEQFEYKKYGEAGCCKCNKPLYKCYVVAEKGDEEGNNWRMFCPECWKDIKRISLIELYTLYAVAKWLD